jgi:hypothetical protein
MATISDKLKAMPAINGAKVAEVGVIRFKTESSISMRCKCWFKAYVAKSVIFIK